MRKAIVYEREGDEKEFDWRLLGRNQSDVVATSGGQGYKNQSECGSMLRDVLAAAIEGVRVEVRRGTGPDERVVRRYTLVLDKDVRIRLRQKDNVCPLGPEDAKKK